MRWWKILGLAGFAGVAATGVVIARSERARRSYTPDEIREQLHARLAAADGEHAGELPPGARHEAPVNGRASAGGRRRPGWRHGARRQGRHNPRLRPHRR